VVEPAKARSLSSILAWLAEDQTLFPVDFSGTLLSCCNNARTLRRYFYQGSNLTEPVLSTAEREQGNRFVPIFDSAGLLTAVVVDAASHRVLVVAHMNQQALDETLASGNVTFWSRSRQRLWMKGETSGNVLKVAEVLVDCDQDALVIRANPAGPTCHTGAVSCFYRRVEQGEDGAPVLVKVKT
jgi:phosphoribosyl-AMP cyclohydrolase